MAAKRKQYRQAGESSDNAHEQERPAHRQRLASRSPSRTRSLSRPQSPTTVVEDEVGPKIRIPAILHYLQDNDIDHTANWSSQLEDIIAYLEYADELRRNGHKDFDAQLQGDLFDCQVVIGVHRGYEKRNRGKTPYSDTKLPTAQPQSHLAWYDRLLPISEKTRAPSRISLIPRERARNSSPFHLVNGHCNSQLYDYYFQTIEGQKLVETLTKLHRDENLWWHSDPSTKQGNMPPRLNLAEVENQIYEDSVTSEDKLYENYAYNRGPRKDEPGAVDKTVKQRGWRRAAFQQLLQLFDSEENRSINTPWRRVALPAPIKERKELPFHTPVKLIDRVEADDGVKNVVTRGVGHSSEEPSPWVYWFNEYLEQSNVLSSFARRNYMLKSWNKSSAIAVPPNFTGPYTFNGKCVYDDNWLKVGKDCVLLRQNLKRTAGMYEPNSRFLPTLVNDIERGLGGHAPTNTLRPRASVDYDPTKNNTFLLLDEFDMAWLKFLMEPGSSPGLIKYSNKTPQHNLLILFDHRIQMLFNDTHQNMFWAKTACAEDHKSSPSYTSQKVPLTELLAIINRGGRKLGKGKGQLTWRASDLNDHDTDPPNTLYQFTLEEARFACIKLARQGRLFYEGPIMEDVDHYVDSTEWNEDTQCRFYQTTDRNDWGCVGMHKIEVFPEQRIIWRHADDEAFLGFNRAYKKHTTTLFTEDSEIDKPKTFAAEKLFKVGTYAEGGFEEARQSPIWEDIVPIDVAAAQHLELSERSSQFFRNLAFRLGRTIRHYQLLQQRVAKSPSLPRKLLKSASAQWQAEVKNVTKTAKEAGYTPIRFTDLTDVIPRAAPNHPAAQSKDVTEIFTAIRKGLINDSVKNYTQTYPSRACFQIAENDRHRKIKTFQRQNVWGWADQRIREHHAPYTRERYFDVRRWPLHRQSEATQEIIKTRKDETKCLQSPLAWYRYGIRVGPASKSALTLDNSIIDVLPSTQQAAASELVKKFKQALVVSMRNANVSIQDDWEFIINPPIRDPSRLLPAAGQSLEPIVRPTSKFIPGPPVFPMGDTLLKQIKISQELEEMLDPHPQNIGSKLMGKFTSWFTPEPERIPLLPEIDTNRAPRSNPLKRRLPPAFLSEIEPAKKVVAITDPTNDRIPTRAQKFSAAHGPRIIESDRPKRPAKALSRSEWYRANFAGVLSPDEEREHNRRERVEAVASLLGGKVVDQDGLAAAAAAPAQAPAPPAWKVKSKAQNARNPDEIPTVEIVKNEDGVPNNEGAGAPTKKVTFDTPKKKEEEGYVWPASVPRPRYSIIQDDGTEAVVIDQEDHGELERAVKAPSSQWPASQVAPPSIILHVNPSRQYTVEDVQRANNPMPNPLSDTNLPPLPRKKAKPAKPSFDFSSKFPSAAPFNRRFSSSATSASTVSLSSATTLSNTNTNTSTPPTSRGSSRKGSRTETTPVKGSSEMTQLPSGKVVNCINVPLNDVSGKPRHPMTRGWLALKEEAFPHGYRAIPTSGKQNLCGVNAIIISLRRQLPALPGVSTLTNASLLAMAKDQRVLDRIAEVGEARFDANSNFTIDTLAAMLEGWGCSHNVLLHLGIMFPAASGRDPMVVPNHHPEKPDQEHVVWILSDDATFRGRREGMTPEQVREEDQRLENSVWNHFSGLEPKLRSSERLSKRN
ncbi:nuclear pore complex component [Apiospora arundinis]